MRMIFVNLPVADVDVARAFYSALGFTFNDQYAEPSSVFAVLDDNIVAALLQKDAYTAMLHTAGGSSTPTFNTLTAVSRQEVDDLVDKALTAGGNPAAVGAEGRRGYGKSFADPDGNVWEITYLEPEHVID